MGKSVWDTVGDIVETAALTAVGAPYLAPVAIGATHGIETGISTGDPLKGLESGVGSGVGAYAGNAIGSSLGSEAFGNTMIGNFTAPLQNTVENAIGGGTFGSMLGGGIGSSIGQRFGDSVFGALNPQKPQDVTGNLTPPGFTPSMQPAMGLPQSLSQFSSMNPNQQATNIASKGVYGGGNGQQEQNYFMNLMNRQLFDKSGNVAANMNGIAPVDMSYLNQLGISGSTPTDYLKGISQYKIA